MSKKMLQKGKNFLTSLAGIALIIVIWDLAVRFTSFSRIFPSPGSVFRCIIESFYTPLGNYTMLGHMGFSLKRVMTGFVVGSVLGILTGVLIGRSRLAESIIRPIYEIIRPIPSVAWIPLAIIWFGIGEKAKIFIIFMAVFSTIVVQVYSGAKRVDSELNGVAYMLGATERKTFVNVVLPSCVPYIFTGLHTALSGGWMAVLAAEMISAREGIGWVITAGQEDANMTLVIAGIVVIATIGLLLSTIMHNIERVLCSWRVKGV